MSAILLTQSEVSLAFGGRSDHEGCCPEHREETGCALIMTCTLEQIIFSAGLTLRENNLWEVCSLQLGPQWYLYSCVHIWHTGGGRPHVPVSLECPGVSEGTESQDSKERMSWLEAGLMERMERNETTPSSPSL